MRTRIKRFLLVIALLGVSGAANAALIDLTFSGSYQNPAGGTIFGESGSDIPFLYTMTYDTARDTNTQFFDTGDMIGANTTSHQWYGYSASGIVASSFTFGTKAFTPADILPVQPGAGALADLWFDTDIALSTPSLSWILFRDADGDLAVGSGYVDLESVIYLGGVSYVQNNDGSFYTVAGPMAISSVAVSAPGTFMLVVLGLTGFLRLRRNKA